jgi:hypothetical protein
MPAMDSDEGLPRLYAEIPYDHAEEFLQALSPTGALSRRFSFEEQSWIFRGQGDARWPLCPSALRPNALAVLTMSNVTLEPTDEIDRAELELDGVLQFAVMADRAGFPLPGETPGIRDPRVKREPINVLHFPPTEYLALTALAQHYGIPTRLLDWTTKPLVAAYFAAWDCIKHRKNGGSDRSHLAVWALSTSFVSAVGPAQDPAFFTVSAPTATNPNLFAQGGVFTLVQPRSAETSKGRLRNLDELLLDLDAADIDPPTVDPDPDRSTWRRDRWSPVFVKFTLPARETRVFVRLLTESGVSAATVFPGLDGVAKAFYETRDHQWAERGSRSC